MKKRMCLGLIILSLVLSCSVSAQDEVIPEPVSVESGQAAASKPSQEERISLDIKGMDIVDVLKMLATRAGMNIIVGKNVTGRVTLFLKDVDVQDAFEIILLANELAYEEKGDIINVMTQRDYELIYGERYEDKKQVKIIQLKYAKAALLATSLNQIKTNIGKVVVDETSNTLALIDTPENLLRMENFVASTDLPLETRVFNLNYAQADKLNTKLQESITKGIGVIKIDERTNKIAVTDYPGKLDEIEKIVSAFDEKTPQVLIDAQVIQLIPSDLFQAGVDWQYIITKYFEVRTSLPVGGDLKRLVLGTPNNLPAPTQEGQFKAVIDVLRTLGDTKVLSSPRIMALNNQEAKIHVGTREAYITSTTSQSGTGTAVTSQSVNFVDTGIQLYVTPTINRNGFVTMKIKPEISDAVPVELLSEGTKTTVPIVTSSEAETTVTVKDGVTVIIGGLNKDKIDQTVRKIPFFGDIPFLGLPFRSKSRNITKTELVILLTPHIMSGESTFSDFAEVPPKEGAVMKMTEGKLSKRKFYPAKETKPANPLFTQSNLLSGYYQRLIERINQFASANLAEGMKGEVKLSFGLSSDGTFSKEPEAIESTDPELVPLAIKTIQDASPFPPFPEGVKRTEESFSVTLDYK